MDNLVTISKAKARLSELVRTASDEEEVIILRHGEPAAVLVGVEQYEALLARIEDLEDERSIDQREGLTLPWEQVKAENSLGPGYKAAS